MSDFKNLKLPTEVHTEIKKRASIAGISMIAYMRLCLIACESDSSLFKKD